MKPVNLVVFVLLLGLICFLVARDIEEFGFHYKDVTPKEAKKLMEKYNELEVIDISGVYDKGHIPGAVNYFIGDGSFDEALKKLDKNKRYLVYYHTDNVSMKAARKLKDEGFKKVYRLQGNFSAWVAAGYRTANKNSV